MKCRYPDVFAAAMLNSQPLGFYAPAQLVRDAREHGVEVREVDVNLSDWDCTLEPLPSPACGERAGDEGRRTAPLPARGEGRGEGRRRPSSGAARHLLPLAGEGIRAVHPRHAAMAPHIRATHAVRLGLRQIVGVREDDMRRLVERRGQGYDSVRDLWLRSGLALDRAGKARRRRRLPLARPRPAPGLMGGARPRPGRRPGRSAAVRGLAAGARNRAGRQLAADAARRACGRGLSPPVAVAQGPSDLVHARAAFRARNPALRRACRRSRMASASPSRASCWCASGPAPPRASSS